MAEVLRHGVAAVVWRDGRLLIGLRAGVHGRGTWGLPGGRMDPGETIDQTAVRHVDTIFPDGARWRTHYVLTEVSAGDPVVMEPTKHERWSWEDPDALPTPLFAALANYLAAQPLVDPAGLQGQS